MKVTKERTAFTRAITRLLNAADGAQKAFDALDPDDRKDVVDVIGDAMIYTLGRYLPGALAPDRMN